MKQFISESDSFERVNLRENEFEALIQRMWGRLTVGWTLADWKPLLDSPYGRVKPDAVAINDDCDRWIVVEVELASHPESHFRTQFQQLETAFYGRHLLDGLSRALPNDFVASLGTLLARERPTFLCIADASSDAIVDACRDFGFQLAVLEPYRSKLGAFGTSVSRIPSALVQPRQIQRFLLTISDEKWGGRLLGSLPSNFPIWDSISLRFDEVIYDLRIVATGNTRRIFLPAPYSPRQGHPTVVTAIDPAKGLFELHDGNQ